MMGHITIDTNIKLAPVEEGADVDGIIYDEWLAARLKLLPKKGDLTACRNWRGICLLDLASKIISSIMSNRMMEVMEKEGLEAQAGFRRLCGTIDGSFSTTLGLQKRQEHGLDTWCVFIDLIKAFDTVIRAATFAVLRKFGMPDHFINLLIRLHTNATMDFMVGDIDTAVPSDIGVRQGSIEGPILFLFFFQAAIETAKWPVAKPIFYTRKNGMVSGENWKRKREDDNWRNITSFELWASLFADDCGLFFETRADLITGSNYIFDHLKRFGLQMHVGRGDTASKTEAMFCPAIAKDYKNGDTSNYAVDGDGFISFTEQFRYLGSMVHYSLTSTADVDSRIESAAKAFGALSRDVFKNRNVSKKAKGTIFVTLVLSMLLYGSECWSMTNAIMAKLTTFYRKRVRTMCRVTISHTIKHRIKTTDLLEQLNIKPLKYYYERRLLRWAGHVARMDMYRLPRKLLTAWVPHPRHNGGQKTTWGKTLNKALTNNNISSNFQTWSELAQNKPYWRALTNPNEKWD